MVVEVMSLSLAVKLKKSLKLLKEKIKSELIRNLELQSKNDEEIATIKHFINTFDLTIGTLDISLPESAVDSQVKNLIKSISTGNNQVNISLVKYLKSVLYI